MSAAQLSHRIREFLGSPAEHTLTNLRSYVASGEFRDEEFDSETYSAFFELLRWTVSTKRADAESVQRTNDVRSVCVTIAKADEFDGTFASDYMSVELASLLVGRASPMRLVESDSENEVRFIEGMLKTLYLKLGGSRCRIRSAIGKFLREYILIPTRTSHLTPILNVLNVIVTGMTEIDRGLFSEILLPLHKPNGWSFWDRQTPVLGEYHKALVQCCHCVIEKDVSLATTLIEYILDQSFPPVNQSNTAKELLLLYEISKFINHVDLSKVIGKLMIRVLDCINSENAQIVQSVLVFWKSPPSQFPDLVRPYLPQYMEALLFALFRGTGEPHWNPTVNKMTLLVLKSLESSDSDLFEKSAQTSIPQTRSSSAAMVSSRPVPPSLAASSSPLQPPLGITGIAPWLGEPSVDFVSKKSASSIKGLEALRQYMHALEPVAVSNDKPWESALSSETPTLMPELKFHNLVFGQDLGTGAFSTVRYARIVRPGGKSYLSQWPEVAVKMVSYATLKEKEYGENVLREICCLRQLAHPSVARLISSFRWRDGIYMVLEYGSLGDLHTYVRRNGCIEDEAMAKVVIGEIATALVTVHESGFVYGDLKPENVVITATRHVKLADFGAARPLTDSARQLLVDSRNALREMRSGDWKTDVESPSTELPEFLNEEIVEPKNFEGTSAYMSPELVLDPGRGPSILSDAYALGLTTYFVLKSRLPQWAVDAGGAHFDSDALMIADEIFATVSPTCAEFIKSLLRRDVADRLSVEESLVHEWFHDVQPVRSLYKTSLSSEHLPGADGGGPVAGGDAAWEKRQLSKIWSAQPADYALVVAGGKTELDEPIMESDCERNHPFA